MSCAMLAGSCTDLDLEPEGNYLTENQQRELVSSNPSLSDGELIGMYRRMASPGTVLGLNALNGSLPYPDDGGYPLICLFFDLNGPDMTMVNSGYNWLASCCDWSDRNSQFRNSQLRWQIFYQQIKAANDILKSLDNIKSNADNLKYKAIRGQALAVRAFDYLNLVPYYQFRYNGSADKLCVPIVTEKSNGSSFGRNTVAEVYNQILNDLTEAIECLEGYSRQQKSYIDQSVAYGLRARANLYMENWADAAADATRALELCSGECDGQPYSMAEVSQPAFCHLEDHNWMWGIKMTGSQVDGQLACWPAWLGSFSGNAYSTYTGLYCMINSLLYDKIDASDVRRGWWVDDQLHSPNLASVSWNGAKGDEVAKLAIADVKEPFLPYTNVKFAQADGCGDVKNGGDWCLMRVEEMILIQAEAYAKAGDETKGRQILTDFVTAYRNPSYSPVCVTFSDEVWMQRRIELWGEGFSMSDIMRLGKPVVRFHDGEDNNVDENFQFNVAAADEYMLLRIPQNELNANKAITDATQNNGGQSPKLLQNGGLRDGVTD